MTGQLPLLHSKIYGLIGRSHLLPVSLVVRILRLVSASGVVVARFLGPVGLAALGAPWPGDPRLLLGPIGSFHTEFLISGHIILLHILVQQMHINRLCVRFVRRVGRIALR